MHVSSKADPQEMVKSDEVIHMGVGDEYMLDPEDLSRLKSIYLSEVEERGFTPVFEFYIDPGIGRGVVYKTGAEHDTATIDKYAKTCQGEEPNILTS